MSSSVLSPKVVSSKLSKEEKAAYIVRWQETKLSKNKFCKQEGINLSTFCSWFPQAPKTHFLPLRIRPAVSKTEQLSTALKITLPTGLSIEGVFELDSLGSWLKEMGSCS